MQTKRRVHVLISGKVQGVFFRYHTYELAKKLGITGWVRNTSDGKVEAVFEGDGIKLRKFWNFAGKAQVQQGLKK